MGLKKMIIARIPHEWEHVLRKNRVLTKYVNIIYEAECPSRTGDNYIIKRRINRIKARMTTHSLLLTLIGLSSEIDLEFWKKIENEIKEYREQCR